MESASSGRQILRYTRKIQSVALYFVLVVWCILLIPQATRAATVISDPITTDTTWTTAGSPYIIGENFAIEPGTTLTIQPGVVIKFDPAAASAGGVVDGKIAALGTAEEPIVFTSLLDDSAGGDTNGDGAATSPAPGDWLLLFSGTSSPPSVFEHVAFRYADTLSFDHAAASFTHIEISLVDTGIYAENGSRITLLDSLIRDIENEGVFAVNGSSVTASSLYIDTTGAEGIALYNDVAATLTDTVIERTDAAALGLYDSTTSLLRTTLRDGASVGVELYDVRVLPRTSSLTMVDSTVENFHDSGVALYDSAASIEHSRIPDNNTGIESYTGRRPASEERVVVSHSSVTGNILGAASYGPYPLDARDNWWGDASGPFHSATNPDGLGDEVGDGVLFDLWLVADPFATVTPACIENCNSNVLFLPGIEASRLYIPDTSALDGNDRLWEPTSDADGRALFMNENGVSIRNDIYTKDVVDEAYGINVYKSFLADLDRWKNTDDLIEDYSVVPYDWRLTLNEILDYGNQTPDGHIYYSGTNRVTATPYMLQELRRLSATSRNNGKVTIIAHSNGGLVAKALIQRLQDTNDPLLEKIDVVIMVAVPQTGTPAALGAVLHGYDQGLPKDWAGFLLSSEVAREFAYNDPMAHHLLPSASYFNGEGATVKTPLATFNNGVATQMFINRYGYTVDNDTELKDFLLGHEGRPLAAVNKLNEPTVLRAGLLSYGETVHQSLDAWTPPSNITVHEIAGWGEDTMAGIVYDNNRKCIVHVLFVCRQYTDILRYKPDLVVDGDGTVVAPSALAMSTSTEQMKRWWVNLKQYNADHRPTRLLPNIEHASILEISELRSFMGNLIMASSSAPLPNYIRNIIPPSESTARLRFFLHSPLALSATDAGGQEISVSTSTIPDARYRRFGEVQYISVPATAAPTLHLDGFAAGSFTLEVQEVQGDLITATTTFLGIPNATTTTAQMSFGDGTIANAGPLMVDMDADGDIDITLRPKVGETVVPDTTAPEIIISFATSTNTLVFTGTDDMGTTTVTATTSYPVLKKKQKVAHGIATTTVTVRDETGNTTALVYTEKLPSPEKRDTIVLEEIAYNGATTTFSNTSVSYKWRTDKNGLYKLFASHIKTSATSTESHYRPKKDITLIMTKSQDIGDDDSDDDVDTRPTKQRLPGMIIPSLVTRKGEILVTY